MNHLKYLRSILPFEGDKWSQWLDGILISNSVQIGTPYDEDLNLLLSKYKKRVIFSKNLAADTFGLNELVHKLSSYSSDHKLTVYPMENEFFTGECVIVHDEIIGCTFIKRGHSVSKKGLWVYGSKVD